ncbi:expressed unknown protein [Seminavis robusta]|uniref:F-box domain-containing protein n=1 Tax=Seminavis robusta TaxID=568900 RepID=A0A9N8HI53_9STRA|nr:expressed unknown protein [Seminavis robusta]|eukprot:Sro757_g197970.1 n/a (690) ;mRNA; r:34623-36692
MSAITGVDAMEDAIMAEAEAQFSPLDYLSNETLSYVLSFCDFGSAVQFCRGINRSLRQDFRQGDHFLWKDMFHRQCFSMPLLAHSSEAVPMFDFLEETRKRRQLARNLLAPKKKKKGTLPARSRCFNLPNRMFHFVPVTPDGLVAEWDDPPPVDFGCDSFILTSPACGGEMVSLDPFHGTLVVHESCLNNAVSSDEAMMEQAVMEAANLFPGNRENRGCGDTTTQIKKDPSQVLFCLENDIDVDACFPPLHDGGHDGAEIDVGYHGIDSKCLLNERTGALEGTMIAVGRMITRETGTQLNGVIEQVVTELLTWERRKDTAKSGSKRNTNSHEFGARKLCRFPWSFRTIDVCATHNRVYVSFDSNDGPSAETNLGSNSHVSRSTVVVYPLVSYPTHTFGMRSSEASSGGCRTNYQEPECFIHCRAKVSSLSVDPTGETLMVGTEAGTCEVWKIHSDKCGKARAKRAAIVNIKSSMSKALRNSREESNDNNNQRLDDDSSRMERTLLTILNRPKIVSFHHASHCPFAKCGFVTLQHSATDGSSLLLWHKAKDSSSSNDAYRIVSMINLPLSGITRAPRVTYDGRRILVFGQDHIGLIVLVYQVLASFEDVSLFKDATLEEASGGVYNLTNPSRVRFANRIRHAALGGLQYYDSIHMTCNDRYIVVNTKTGNLLGESTSPCAEGLLVIDLQD